MRQSVPVEFAAVQIQILSGFVVEEQTAETVLDGRTGYSVDQGSKRERVRQDTAIVVQNEQYFANGVEGQVLRVQVSCPGVAFVDLCLLVEGRVCEVDRIYPHPGCAVSDCY